MQFRGTPGHRDYLICSDPGRSNGLVKREGRVWVGSFAEVPKAGDFDLRDQKDAAEMEHPLTPVEV